MAAMARPDRLMLTPAMAKVMPPTELKPRAQTRMTAAMIRLRLLEKSTLVLDHVAHADSGDHAVEHEADAADDAGGDGVDDGLKLGAEAQDHGKHSGDADDQGIVNLGQGQDAGVLAVGGVGGAAQQAGHGSGQAVAQQGLVQARIADVVLAGGGGDGGDVADMLHHGGQGDGHDGEHRTDEGLAAVHGKQTHAVLMDGDAEPGGGTDGLVSPPRR